MKHPDLLRAAMLAATMLGAGGVLAQTAPSTVGPPSTPIVSDAAPLPPEERGSTGALVLSPVRAQRDNPTARMGAGPAVKSVTRRADRSATANELEQTRLDQEQELRRRGAAGLEAN